MGGIWVGGSGNPKSVTVDAMFGVLVADGRMPSRPASPVHMSDTSEIDGPGRCQYLRVNDDGDVAAEEAVEEVELSVGVRDGDGEYERGNGGCFGLWKSSTLRTCIRKLGG